LDFPTETDVTVAVGLSEQNLDGRKLLIKASSDYTGRPLNPALAALPPLDPSALEPSSVPSASSSTTPLTGTGTAAPPQTLNRTARKILNRQKNPAGPTLFLGNLGFETVVDDIRDMFDRNQKRSREWEKKAKGEKKKKSSKGKKKREEGQDEESESEREEEEGAEEEEEESEKESESEEESEAEEENEDEDADLTQKKPRKDKQKKKEKGPLDLAKAETAGIRKIRLGTFEDTGKCKG
jgi:membrane peptidoglycan carboxypeptidase